MSALPTGYPGASRDAVKLLYQLSNPSLEDLRVMSMIEAAGETFYRGFAALVSSAEAKQLLLSNARDERRHGERLVKAIALLGGGVQKLPHDDDNPYVSTLQVPSVADLSADYFDLIASAEDSGHDGYLRWANSEPNPEVAVLYRMNAREEKLHGRRNLRVKALLAY